MQYTGKFYIVLLVHTDRKLLRKMIEIIPEKQKSRLESLASDTIAHLAPKFGVDTALIRMPTIKVVEDGGESYEEHRRVYSIPPPAYHPKNNEIVVTSNTNIQEVAHECGHSLHYTVNQELFLRRKPLSNLSFFERLNVKGRYVNVALLEFVAQYASMDYCSSKGRNDLIEKSLHSYMTLTNPFYLSGIESELGRDLSSKEIVTAWAYIAAANEFVKGNFDLRAISRFDEKQFSEEIAKKHNFDKIPLLF